MSRKYGKGRITGIASRDPENAGPVISNQALYDAAIEAYKTGNVEKFAQAFHSGQEREKQRHQSMSPQEAAFFKQYFISEEYQLKIEMNSVIEDLKKTGKPEVSQFIQTWWKLNQGMPLGPQPPSATEDLAQTKTKKG